MTGELGVASKALDRADLAEQLGGAERAAAQQAQQRWCEQARALLQLPLKLEHRACEAAAAGDEIARDPHLGRLLAAGKPPSKAVQPEPAVEPAERYVQPRLELVQVPAQALLAAAPLGDQVVAVIDQQLQLP